jgi:hypothetical protein
MAARASAKHVGAWTVLSGLSQYVLIGLIAFTVWLSMPQLGGTRAERVSSFLGDTAGSVFAKDQPAGATAAADRAVPTAVPAEEPPLRELTISEGDTLFSIALLYLPRGKDLLTFVEEIAALNELADADSIFFGQAIRIPSE